MDKSFYTEYYELERNHWWFLVRENIIQDQLRTFVSPDNNLKIINIGVATGRTSEILAKFGRVTSLEYDSDCCDFTSKVLGTPVLNASVTDLPFPDKEFDLVCAFDVIEHVDNDLKAVQEMKRVCKNGGVIFITVPAFMQLWSHHDEINKHFRRYVMKQIINLFIGNDGNIINKTYFNSILFLPVLIFRFLSRFLPSRLVRKGAGSDFTVINKKSFINRILYSLFNFERNLLKKIKFPFGVSILFLWKKNKVF